MNHATPPSAIPRRRFLETTTAAVTAFTVIPRHVLGGTQFVPPSEKINIAIVGAGGQGRTNMRELFKFPDAQIVAVADPIERENLDAYYFKGEAGRLPVKAEAEKRYSAATPNFKVADYEDFRIMLEKEKAIDAVLCATPDHLHTPPILAAIKRGAHVVAEKPLALTLADAREIIAKSRGAGTVVAVDMHKRYDSFLRSAFVDVVPRLGDLLYGRAVLEEPLRVSTSVFKWAEHSNPFSYVGVHWTDLFAHYLKVRPVSLYAVGQKKLLAGWRDEYHPNGINTFDALQVSVQYDNGLNVQYVNAWINPEEFEGAVNQEMEIVGSLGRVFVDQQDRGMRSTIIGDGSRTHNPHFQAEVPSAGRTGTCSCIGYCKDSLVAGLDAAARVALGLADRAAIAGTYPDAESALSCVAILEAAAKVAAANHEYRARGQGMPVSARFKGDDFEIVEPKHV